MKVPPRGLDAFIKNPPREILAVLVYGPDEGLARERLAALARAGGADPADPFGTVELPAERLSDDPAALLDEAKSISLLGGRKVVRLRGASDKSTGAIKAALAALSPGDNMILVEGGELGPRSTLRLLFEGAPNAAALPCYVEDARDAGRFLSETLRAAGYRVSSDALAHLTAHVTGDRAIVRSEAEKLMTYMGGMKEIDLTDAQACVGAAAALSLDDLARLAASGKFAEADRILAFALSEGTGAVPVLRALQSYFMRLHLTRARMDQGESAATAVAKLKPPLFFKHKDAFEAQVGALSSAQIEQALGILGGAEARCKQTGAQTEVLAGRALLAVCQICGRAAARRRALS